MAICVKARAIKKSSFDGEWPFYADTIVVQLRNDHYCVVFIGNDMYALNGLAQDFFNMKGVHEAGMAIIGKSIGPFIDIALNLGKK